MSQLEWKYSASRTGGLEIDRGTDCRPGLASFASQAGQVEGRVTSVLVIGSVSLSPVSGQGAAVSAATCRGRSRDFVSRQELMSRMP